MAEAKADLANTLRTHGSWRMEKIWRVWYMRQNPASA
jgi:hypothetical protein